VLLRPEALSIVPRGEDPLPGDLGGVISDRRFAGAHTYYQVKLADEELTVVGSARDARVGEPVHVRVAQQARIYAYGGGT
jgi:hypothetical protein